MDEQRTVDDRSRDAAEREAREGRGGESAREEVANEVLDHGCRQWREEEATKSLTAPLSTLAAAPAAAAAVSTSARARARRRPRVSPFPLQAASLQVSDSPDQPLVLLRIRYT